MKRDMELVRKVLLKIESFDLPPGVTNHLHPSESGLHIEGYDADQIGHHLVMLIDGGFVDVDRPDMSGLFGIRTLTWKGHEFLDTIRSPEVWRKTKDGLGKLGGWSVDLAWEMAKAYGKQLTKEKLGLDLS